MKADLLSGYTVVLNAHYIPGPVAAWFLKSLGARVIKIEPLSGDMMRRVPPFFSAGESGDMPTGSYFHALNQGFESIALDLKQAEGIDIFKALLCRADIYIDGNRPGFVEKITGRAPGEINPELITVPITAYGQTGPYTPLAGHDGNCLSIAGALSFNPTAKGNAPAMIGTQIADITSGLIAALTSLAMLIGKNNPESNSSPNLFDCAMLDAAMLFNQIYIGKLSADNAEMVPDREWLNGGRGYYKIYRTRDGRSVFFAAIEDKLFRNFAERVNRPDLIEIRKSAEEKPELLLSAMEALFLSRDFEEWRPFFTECDCCLTPVNTIREAMEDEQVKHRDLIRHMEEDTNGPMYRMGYPGLFDGLPLETPGNAPDIGENTARILEELLFEETRIRKLYENKVVV